MIEQLASTRQRHDAFEIFNLAPFHNSVLGFVVCVGQVFTHGRDAWASMCLGHDFLRRETVGPRPSAPNPRYRRRRVDEHSIHIEQKSTATDMSHDRVLTDSTTTSESSSHARAWRSGWSFRGYYRSATEHGLLEITSILRVLERPRINRISGKCPIAALSDYVKTQEQAR